MLLYIYFYIFCNFCIMKIISASLNKYLIFSLWYFNIPKGPVSDNSLSLNLLCHRLWLRNYFPFVFYASYIFFFNHSLFPLCVFPAQCLILLSKQIWKCYFQLVCLTHLHLLVWLICLLSGFLNIMLQSVYEYMYIYNKPRHTQTHTKYTHIYIISLCNLCGLPLFIFGFYFYI